MPTSFTNNRTPITPQRTLLIASGLMFLGAILIVILAQYTELDLILASYYFDPVRRTFPWDQTWFGRDFMHGYLKNVIVWFGFLLIAATAVDFFFPLRRLTPLFRLQLRYLMLAAVLEPLLVRSLKESSNLHCPVGIDLYGGSSPYLRLLDWVPEGWKAGHCFPAGHASAGMWLSALAILWLPSHPRKALAVFFGGLSVGLAMGWVQQMRGMHFLSHTLATTWLSTALMIVLLTIFWRPLNAAARTNAHANDSFDAQPSQLINA
ncbi:MAG: phosphatase PAP2 family protein [Zoogloeaceae bacterium]|nr:phosphatase PAP2 family protein [Zoogloeaceae bacterium]